MDFERLFDQFLRVYFVKIRYAFKSSIKTLRLFRNSIRHRRPSYSLSFVFFSACFFVDFFAGLDFGLTSLMISRYFIASYFFAIASSSSMVEPGGCPLKTASVFTLNFFAII